MKAPKWPRLKIPAWKAEFVRGGLTCALIWPVHRNPPVDNSRLRLVSGKRQVDVFPEPPAVDSASVTIWTARPLAITAVESAGVARDPARVAELLGFDMIAWRAERSLAYDLRRRWPQLFAAGRIDTWLVRGELPAVHSIADYRARYGEPIRDRYFGWLIDHAGWRETERDADLPPDMPRDLFESVGGGKA